MNCLAVDDEPLALNIIQDFCSKIDFVNLEAKCTNPLEALKVLNQQAIDLIFLDIQMPNITGLEFIRTIANPPLVILTTAYTEHALAGFEINAVDYLVKPIPFERFVKAVNKAYELHNLRNRTVNPASLQSAASELDYLMIKVEYSTVRLNLNDIIYIEGLKDYLKIYVGTGKPILTKSTMKHIEEKLPATKFVRVHKSFIVSLSKIRAIENNRILIADNRIPIGDQFKANFYQTIGNNLL